MSEISVFIDGVRFSEHDGQVPAGLIVTGPNIATKDLLFAQIADHLRSDSHTTTVILRSGDAPNLRTVLKKLIRDATNHKAEDEEDISVGARYARKPLNYDLQLLHDHLKSSPKSRIVVALQDSEGFDSGLLAELLSLFSSWLNRIPFIVLLGIATSVELFCERLPQTATRCLRGVQIDADLTSTTLDDIFRQAVVHLDSAVAFGPGFITSLLERQHEHIQSPQALLSAVKYACMLHFYANPLSVLSGAHETRPPVVANLQPEHLEAIRMLPSFKLRVENLLSERKMETARALLDSDEDLLSEVSRALENRRMILTNLLRKLHVFYSVATTSGKTPNRLNLCVQAVGGQLDGSEILKDFLGSISVLSANDMVLLAKGAIQAIMSGDDAIGLDGWSKPSPLFLKELERIRSETATLIENAEKDGATVRSRYAPHYKTVRTTVVAQKVLLSKEKSSLSKLDESYSDLVDDLADLLKDYFKFGDLRQTFMHEVWLHDSKSANREMFTPRPRYAVERALTAPHDYLGCTCCKASEGLSASQPPTAILYQLYLETSGLINVFDLWSAFSTIISGEKAEDDERRNLALFYRALADLRLLGMIKQSRKKTDHLAKLMWRGL